MSETFNKNSRIVFRKGKQKRLILDVLNNTGLGIGELSVKIKINRRTLADWKREKFNISGAGLNTLLKFSGIKFKDKVEERGRFWYTSKAGKIGYQKVIEKHGRIMFDEMKRIRGWEEWWKKEGKEKGWEYAVPKAIFKPKESNGLAEFFGAMIGDGGMSKYQASITLHYKDDFEYGKYLSKLIKKLFKISPSVNRYANVNVYRVSRAEIVNFLNGKGLKIGNKVKQDVDIPDWIKNNQGFSKKCIRGIFDTDGCLVMHNYISNGKMYKYKKIDITSASEYLRLSIHSILNGLGIKNRIGRQQCVRVEAKEDVDKFMKIIGSSNPKHLKKYKEPIF